MEAGVSGVVLVPAVTNVAEVLNTGTDRAALRIHSTEETPVLGHNLTQLLAIRIVVLVRRFKKSI